jgi:hypothetical protein
MNATRTISIVVLATAAAWAQGTASKPATKATASSTKTAAATKTPATKATAAKPASQMAPASTKTAPAAKTAAATAKTTKAPGKTVAPSKTAVAPTKALASKTAPPAAKKPAGKTVQAVTAKTAPPAAAAKSIVPAKIIGKRDPFVSVIVARSDSSAACTGGKRCLVVDQLALRGIVRTPTKWIAMVENPARKTYYLYENDPIFNAVVVRITGDSVIFRESVMDALGHSTEREVVKRVNAPAI